MKYILINKKFVLAKNATISIDQRACRFGDGIFETCKIVDGIIYNYESHQARLKHGLKVLQIFADIKNLEKDSYHLIKKNQIKNGILKISISRGIGSLGYLPIEQSPSLIMIETLDERKISAPKIRLGVSKIKAPKFGENLQKCKSMQSLNYVLAKIAAKNSGNFDDVMLSHEGFVSECSSANIFWIKNGKIFTPSKKCDMLFGTARKKLLQKFPQKINQVAARLSSLKNADEIFLTNASFLVLPIDELVILDKKIKFKKTTSAQILQWFEADVKKYISLKNGFANKKN